MWALFIRFGAWLLGGLVAIVPTLVGQILIALGIGVVTYTGVDVSLSFLKTQALSNLHSLPTAVVALIAYMKVGICISMVASATAMRLALDGLNSGTVKRWVKK